MAKATTQQVEQVVNEYEQLLDGDTSKLDILSESFTYHAPGMPDEGLGQEGFEQYLNSARERFPDLHVTIENGLVDDTVTMQEWKMVGTHEGEVDGIPPTGREMEMHTMSTTVVSDGKIQAVREYFDQQELMSQMEPEE